MSYAWVDTPRLNNNNTNLTDDILCIATVFLLFPDD
jgi:hypothetical protein